MTDITLEQRARVLLAAEYRRLHFDAFADDIAADRLSCVPMTSTGTALRAIEAALRLSAGADWVLVPREPTDEMIHNMAASLDYPSVFMGGPSERSKRAAARTYRAMIAAAPRHEPGEG